MNEQSLCTETMKGGVELKGKTVLHQNLALEEDQCRSWKTVYV